MKSFHQLFDNSSLLLPVYQKQRARAGAEARRRFLGDKNAKVGIHLSVTKQA